jgi:hypothetical protein
VESVLTYTSGLKFSSPPKKEYSVTIFFVFGVQNMVKKNKELFWINFVRCLFWLFEMQKRGKNNGKGDGGLWI